MEDELNEAIPDTSRILMSDVLRDRLPADVAPDDMQSLANNYIMVVLGRVTAGLTKSPIVGTLEGIMFHQNDMEIEAKVDLDDALAVLSAAPSAGNHSQIRFEFIELHNAEDVIPFRPKIGFNLEGARVDRIDYRRRMAVLMLNLRHAG